MKEFYRQTFDELLSIVKCSREKIIENHKNFNKEKGSILCLGDLQYSCYKSMIEANELRAAKAIEKIAQKLLENQKGVPFELYPIDEYFGRMSLEEQIKSRPYQLILLEHNKTTGVVFCDFNESIRFCNGFRCGKYKKIDSLKIVLLVEGNGINYVETIKSRNEIYKKLNLPLEYVTIKYFWERYFGVEEYHTLITHINEFNESAKSLIGFNTVLVPTDAAISHFKEQTGNWLKAYPYSNYIPNDIYHHQIEILLNNYINHGLWRAMIGSKNFAVSFISSEWYFQMYKLTENLDLTGIVAGYLKSIEQLIFAILVIFAILELSKDKGITIKHKNRPDIIEYSAETERFVDSTLYSLQQVIKHNNIFWPEVNKYTKRHIDELLSDWREKHRNGYFHKDSLQSMKIVNEIRDRAIQLYFLILGASKINEDQFGTLGIYS